MFGRLSNTWMKIQMCIQVSAWRWLKKLVIGGWSAWFFIYHSVNILMNPWVHIWFSLPSDAFETVVREKNEFFLRSHSSATCRNVFLVQKGYYYTRYTTIFSREQSSWSPVMANATPVMSFQNSVQHGQSNLLTTKQLDHENNLGCKS